MDPNKKDVANGKAAPPPDAFDVSNVIYDNVALHSDTPSVVVLNEACEKVLGKVIDRLSERAGREWYIADFQTAHKDDGKAIHCDDSAGGNFGNAIVANMPAASVFGRAFRDEAQCNTRGDEEDNGNDERRNFVGATFAMPFGSMLTLLGSHLTTKCKHAGNPSNGRVKAGQVQELRDVSAEQTPRGGRIIVAGDFNAGPGPLLQPLSEAYQEVDPGGGCPESCGS